MWIHVYTVISLSLCCLGKPTHTMRSSACCARLLGWLVCLPACFAGCAVLAVIACLLAAGLPDGLHQHTHIDTFFLYNTCSDTIFFYTRFSIHLCLYALVLYNTPRIPNFLYTFFIYAFFLYNTPFFLYTFFYTSHLFSIQHAFFLYNLTRVTFWWQIVVWPNVFAHVDARPWTPFLYTDCFRHTLFLYTFF